MEELQVCKHSESERMTRGYRELINLAPPTHALYPALVCRGSDWYKEMVSFCAVLDLDCV